jgi:hypothetical protein
MSARYGTFKILEAAQGRLPPDMSHDQVDLVCGHFKVVLELDNLEGVSVNELLDALNPENPLERIVYRKQAAKLTTNRLEFVNIKNKEQQVAHSKEKI